MTYYFEDFHMAWNDNESCREYPAKRAYPPCLHMVDRALWQDTIDIAYLHLLMKFSLQV